MPLTPLKDWLDFTSQDERRTLRRELENGPSPMIRMGAFWGDGTNVICAGDAGHAERETARLFRNKFHRTPCPMDVYGDGYCAPATVAERLNETRAW